MAPSGADSSWVVERVRAVQADVGAANRLLDLLLRLAEIAGERPERRLSATSAAPPASRSTRQP